MLCGIYKLVFDKTDKVYIGKSYNIENRYAQHLSSLKRGAHSRKMLKAYQDYGIPVLQVLELCTEEQSLELEEKYIQEYDSYYNGFNSTKSSIGISTRDTFWSCKSIYDQDQVCSVFHLLIDKDILPYSIIESITGVTTDTIAAIARGRVHKWLKTEYPIEYGILLSKIGSRKNYKNCAEAQGIYYPEIVSPNGEVFTIANTCEFAREHNLDQRHLHKVLTSRRLSHKGWKLLTTEKVVNIMSWTEDQKKQAIQAYKDANPTPETSTEIITEIADSMEQSANGLRMILVQAGVYVKKEPATATAGKTGTTKTGDKAPRVSKEDQITALRVAIEEKGAKVDDEILSKLTGKAAAYFLEILNT